LPIDEGARSFSELVACEVKKGVVTGKDTWWVAIEDLVAPVDDLPESSRRMMKNVESGIAALISTSAATEPILSRSFSTLPLAIPSDLPVHIHATFSLSGDRQSIAIDEYGQQSHGSKWNRYLLQVALPRLYLAFLEDVGTQVRQRIFEFWPREEPPKRSCAELLCASFWEQLPKSSRRIFSKAQLDGESRHRRAADLLDINQAVFDFLPLQQSDILAGVLISMDVNLVRHIPAEISRRLKAVQPKVKSVTGSMLRQLFKSDRGRIRLLNESTKRPRIVETIFRHAIPAEDELTDLDGCHLLPLADGSLATFKHLGRGHELPPKYCLASGGELDLFTFASECFVDPVIGIWLRPVLDSGKYNLASFRLCHVERLLRMRPVVPTPNPEADKWLTDFWEFWDGSPDAEALSSDITNSCAQIFRSTREGRVNYASPTDFQSFPAVVEPSILEHQQLCAKIPGLYHFEPKLMPKALLNGERSLYNKDSFSRLVRALSTLAKPSGVGEFVKQHLVQADLKVPFP
jgi:sacsin